jgi:hypothetical protein
MTAKTEQGSVFVIILMAVVLFGALAFTVTRTMRTQTTSTLSARQAEIVASDILTYAQRAQRAVDRVRQNSCSESDISFDNTTVSGYDHTVAPPDDCEIFQSSGGGLQWRNPPESANDGSQWFYSDNHVMSGHGDGSKSDLILILPNVDMAVCKAINAALDISLSADPPVSSGAPDLATKAQGNYAAAGAVIGPGTAGFTGLQSACFTNGGNNYFYIMLLAR